MSLTDYDENRYARRGGAYDEDSDEEEEAGHAGPGGVQCAQS